MRVRVAVALLILALLAGCSALKIVYNQADLIAIWMADDYFDLRAEQKDAFRDYFQRLHAWHRTTQLVQYVSLLESAQERLRAGVKASDATWAIDSAKTQFQAIVQHGYADAARILSGLSAEQLTAARRQFEKTNQKYAKEYGAGAPAETQRRLRAERNLERIEHWTGPLSSAQEARIEELSQALPLIADPRLLERLHRQREFLALLAERKHIETFAPRLRNWLIDWDRTRTPQYQAALARFLDASAALYVEVFALLTPEQRTRVSERLQGYIALLRQLAHVTAKTALLPSWRFGIVTRGLQSFETRPGIHGTRALIRPELVHVAEQFHMVAVRILELHAGVTTQPPAALEDDRYPALLQVGADVEQFVDAAHLHCEVMEPHRALGGFFSIRAR